MSKYLPVIAVEREKLQQQLRAIHGVKVGTHVRFPHAELGPFIIRKDRLEALTAEDQNKLREQAHLTAGTKPENTQAQKLKKGFKRLFGGLK